MENINFSYEDDVLVILKNCTRHLYPFNNKIGKVVNKELTIKYKLNNHPEHGIYVLLFKHFIFSEKEQQYLKDNNCPIYNDENGILCYVSNWIFENDEAFVPNKKLMIKNDLVELAKVN